MKLIEKILLPVDFSESSDDAVEAAINISSVFGSHILLIHVIPNETEISAILKEAIKEKVREKLNSIKEKFISRGIYVDKTTVVQGNPVEEIVSEADYSNVNVVLIGGGNNISNVKLGTTAEKLIRKSQKPVWVIASHKLSNPTKILCAVDFSKSSVRALKNSIHIARRFNAELVIISIVKNLNRIYGMLIGSAEEEQNKIINNHQKKFDALLKESDFHGVKFRTVIKQGSPEKEILDMLKSESFDLLVIGAAGDSKGRSATLGSVAEKVIREMPCSVIVMFSEDAVKANLKIDMDNILNCTLQGKELLKNGMTEDAINHFKHCVEIDAIYTPAWDGMAEAYDRLGKAEEAGKCRSVSKEINDKLWAQRVQSEIRKEKFMR